MTATVTDINGGEPITDDLEPRYIDPDTVDFSVYDPNIYQPLSLNLDPKSITWEQWASEAHRLKKVERGHQWWWADLIRIGEDVFGEAAYGIFDDDEFDDKTIQQWVRVAVAFPPPDRRHELSFSHHKNAAALPTLNQRRAALKWAVENDASTRELAAYVKAKQPDDDGESTAATEAAEWHTWRVSFRLRAESESVGDEMHQSLLDLLDELAEHHNVEAKVEHAKS